MKPGYLSPGLLAFKEGRFVDAGPLLSAELREESASENRCKLYYYQGLSYMFCGDLHRALESFHFVIESDHPGEFFNSALHNLGMNALALNDIDYSGRCLQLLNESQPGDNCFRRVWKAAILLHQNEQRLPECLNEFKTAYGHLFHENDFKGLIQLESIIAWSFDEFPGLGKISHFLNAIQPKLLPQSFSLNFVYFREVMHDQTEVAEQIYRRHQEFSSQLLSRNYRMQWMQLVLNLRSGLPRKDALKKCGTLLHSIEEHADPSMEVLRSWCRKYLQENEQGPRFVLPMKHGIVGLSSCVLKLRKKIDSFSQLRLPVFLLGESGTGKELCARALHDASPWNKEPFVALNCAALPDTLAESLLFGSERGAYTGAEKARRGLVESAAEGSLFLDEVAELSPILQLKLLRFLECGEYRRLGGDQLRHSRCRVITAANRELEHNSQFRQDLYHRISRLILLLPPLRERGRDCIHLARYRVQELNRQHGEHRQLTAEAELMLRGYDFPGNVRELFNRIDRAWHDCGGLIQVKHLELESKPESASFQQSSSGVPMMHTLMQSAGTEELRLPYPAPMDELEARLCSWAFARALAHNSGNLSAAARSLGVSRRTFYRRQEEARKRLED